MSEEQTARRREAVEAVHGIVTAMRAIAAGRIQAAQRALEAARRYHEVVLLGIATLLADAEGPTRRGDDGRPTTLLALTSEQPFCGAFNQGLVDLTERRRHELAGSGPVRLLVVGHRGLRQFVARGLIPDDHEPAATSLAGLHDLVKRLAALLGRRWAAGELGSLRVLYNRYQSVSEQIPTEVSILPPDLEAIRRTTAVRPGTFAHYLPRPDLLAGLVDEYAFISLYLLAAESYTSEQASRLVAMDASTRNTESMLESLRGLLRRQRQEQVTREVLELIGTRFAPGD